MTPIRIAITKGRLLDSSVAMFKRMGIECEALEKPGRRLILPLDGGRIEAVLAKGEDVVTYVDHGVCDMGIVGKDTLEEHPCGVFEVLDLGFGKCRMAVAGRPDSGFFSSGGERTAATKYDSIARAYFKQKGMDVRLIHISGSVELAPLLGLSDVIVDIVETGDTLRANGLEVLEEVCPLSARLIINPAAMKLRKSELDALTAKMEANLK
ncbi:MAG: ATP phosphoribosyltransferase [Clostridia bacterium]|nr:ATP phosphoribosyltransferase [Clostridia bacterium]